MRGAASRFSLLTRLRYAAASRRAVSYHVTSFRVFQRFITALSGSRHAGSPAATFAQLGIYVHLNKLLCVSAVFVCLRRIGGGGGGGGRERRGCLFDLLARALHFADFEVQVRGRSGRFCLDAFFLSFFLSIFLKFVPPAALKSSASMPRERRVDASSIRFGFDSTEFGIERGASDE